MAVKVDLEKMYWLWYLCRYMSGTSNKNRKRKSKDK